MTEIDILVQQVTDKVHQLTEHICSNKVTSFDEYKYLCGEVQGLLAVRGYALDLKDKMERYDDE